MSFDLFGTLLVANGPENPAAAVADRLRRRGVAVPDEWEHRFAESHCSRHEGQEVSLVAHVLAALAEGGSHPSGEVVHDALLAAFDPAGETLPGAIRAVRTAAEEGPVAVCSNCSVPGLVERALDRSTLDASEFECVLASVDVGWRKPHPRIFRRLAERMDCRIAEITHIGDDPQTDTGIERVGGSAIVLEDRSLDAVPARLEGV